MSIKKTKNGTYHLKVYIPNEVQPKLGLGAYYEKRFKTRREAKDAELKLSVDIENSKPCSIMDAKDEICLEGTYDTN